MGNSSPENIWDQYTRLWFEPDESKRIKQLEQCLSLDCVYSNPSAQIIGLQHLSWYMSDFQKNISGIRFINTGFKYHHDRSLSHWDMVDANGTLLSMGSSFGLYGNDGRLEQITCLIDLTIAKESTEIVSTPTDVEDTGMVFE